MDWSINLDVETLELPDGPEAADEPDNPNDDPDDSDGVESPPPLSNCFFSRESWQLFSA